ncbi:MAG TPA: enoyl-CoA hydratase/isomerase family protein [Gammaproteobacteria bacterium]|nr:enoyl-CoA hydratase/isomerase family protein [Gammaproteobacteria bacterium]
MDVLFNEMLGRGGDLGIITLNRPGVLNALNNEMVFAIRKQLKAWAIAKHIKAVVIRSSGGRAFSAGGDLRALSHHLGDAGCLDFFREEYLLNTDIFFYPKPYIALLDGLTMGGGAGISLHGSHCVGTENLVFAMPETAIGFFPDVGATYFLSRLTSYVGFYLGLTGARLNSDDCMALGIVQHKIPASAVDRLVDKLASTDFLEAPLSTVTRIIQTFDVTHVPLSFSDERLMEIAHCFSQETMEDIITVLAQGHDNWYQKTVETLYQRSPTSLKATLLALQLARQRSFRDCMRQEYRLMSHFLDLHDLREGIRAVIIDKDQKPQWDPARLDCINKEQIERYFDPISVELFDNQL